MEESARLKLSNNRTQVLITGAGSYLGASLTDSLILENCDVFGVGNSRLLSPFLSKENFTLLELELGQPLPSYLPQFDLIFHLDEAGVAKDSYEALHHFSQATKSIIALAQTGKTQVVLVAPLSFRIDSFDYLIKDDATCAKLRIFLVGDIYGPKMPVSSQISLGPVQKELASLISQAVATDKVILEEEGMKMIYPTYISDAVEAINKFAFSPKTKDVQIIVCEEPISSLSVAYEIQNVASLVGAKQLGLFFAGGPAKNKITPQPLVNASHLGFNPNIKLTEGLKLTFEYFKDKGLFSSANQVPREHQRTNYQSPSWEKLHPQEADTQSFSERLRLKVPKITLNLRFKNLVILLLLILFGSILKTGLDVYLGASKLNDAKKALMLANFDKAESKAKGAQNSFKAAQNKFNILSFPLSLVISQKIKSTNLAFAAAGAGSQSLFYFSLGAKTLSEDFALITSKQTSSDGFDLEAPSADFKRALFFSSKAVVLSSQAKKSAPFAAKIESLKDSFEKLHNLSSSALEITQLLNDFTGGGQKTYLILLQNNSELRPGGGFIGNFGTLEFEGGKLNAVNVDDIYTIDGQLKEKIQPPKQLKEKLGIDNFFLRDSNWSGDFALNAATARDFFKKETGRNVDGVIAFDLTFIQDVLGKMGPVKLDDYNEEISAQNLFERGEYYSEVGFFPGSTQKRDFFGSLSRKMISQVLADIAQITTLKDNEKTASPLLPLVQVFKESLEKKHILVSFDNPTLASYVATHGWDSPLPPRQFDVSDNSTQTRDFLAISEANLGANKVNRFLQRKISYEMTVGRDADLVGRLTITYTNNSQAETWPAGKYVNFLRVYVPAGSDLFEIKNGDITDLKSVEVTTTGPLATFATYVEVPIKSTKQVSFSYRIPRNIKLESAPTYHLYIQKQPGTENDPLEFKFNLPGYLLTKSVNGDEKYSNKQNLTVETDLAADRQFEIEVVKK
ncbi:hypothetical protein A3D81_02280 [Candidatus Curtissbacteria bacterium RIFCSPHIGHO2_02_FULL_40_17]|uniref:NAD-dependent epimerase/dehydratase domain-containing protein n=3 Tax=Candidatus Curtissiibacteriota TaxID=1752717 RepID=A0A1F5GH49_9BACT|nr:MAG: hypothetical protein A2693_00115 [Candidatus Curtissbacteria bacterium RIFCSPHIGHO2_01_FULL_40_12]OGD91198.1 MAG: hypothetical protein A3D81_02280 [Candidatus Curtissbacteria bacterium RIFCSPHIGHO2_02_FULL_40_17]OGE03213.1 MAG: hypothetical protein A3F45_04230 [Candidatus Curtissbacteria bacterium RIFCSPHIGHO2_12_FULL_41_17]